MHIQDFRAAVAQMTVIPDDVRSKFLALAGSLPEAELETIFQQLKDLETANVKNETKHVHAVSRGKQMVQQISEQDVPAFDALLDA